MAPPPIPQSFFGSLEGLQPTREGFVVVSASGMQRYGPGGLSEPLPSTLSPQTELPRDTRNWLPLPPAHFHIRAKFNPEKAILQAQYNQELPTGIDVDGIGRRGIAAVRGYGCSGCRIEAHAHLFMDGQLMTTLSGQDHEMEAPLVRLEGDWLAQISFKPLRDYYLKLYKADVKAELFNPGLQAWKVARQGRLRNEARTARG
ncbi:hypothetical protein LTR97_010598 [Elasticomyces elasticus]|uniref:Uncharacterized protein n=1 Tax=Elasticomyces elasticus TaxID=574655 RepID=A0AAN7ZRH0_9PEZI|nr:hypothetical protein LTR97_010598 [Elasticomyces elasticus]